MEESEVYLLKGLIEGYHERFAGCFGRKESRVWARRYVDGLLMDVERRNCWQLAEKLRLSPKELKAMQHFLYAGAWDHKAVIQKLLTFVCEQIGSDDGVLIVDESGVRKWGKKSVGVGRQHLGCVGKKDNGQVGVFLSYGTAMGHAFLDTRLYILREWFADSDRCWEAGIPESVVFRTKPQLAAEMVRAAIRRDVSARWLTADEGYGRDTRFLDDVESLGLWYVVEVPKDTHVWTSRPRLRMRRRGARGRPLKKPRLSANSRPSVPVEVVAQRLQDRDWDRIEVADSTKGPLVYEFAFKRVIQKRSKLPGPSAWLMVRRTLEQDPEMKYYLSIAPEEVECEEIARVGSRRWLIENGFREGKGQTGLDQYEVRCWNSWHHHVVLSMLAHAFLVAATVEWKKNRARPDLGPEGKETHRAGTIHAR